jgi:glycosyltransferase involved in cell wall biosynthesis
MSLHKAIKAKRDGKKVIMWSHVTVEDLEKSVKLFKIIPGMGYVIRKYLKYAYSIPNMVFCPTQYTKDVLISYGLKHDTLFVQSNAVDINKFFKDIKSRDEYRAKYNLEGIVIGNMALVMYRKGIDTFIKLAEKFSQNKFIWFGKIFSKIFVQRISLNTPKNTNFTGFVDNANSALNALDIFLFPSYEENQGMVILEAAAVGLPILIRNLPAYEGWMIHDANCLKADSDEEFEKYLNLLISDTSLRERLGNEALLLANRESIPILSEKLKLIYEKL